MKPECSAVKEKVLRLICYLYIYCQLKNNKKKKKKTATKNR